MAPWLNSQAKKALAAVVKTIPEWDALTNPASASAAMADSIDKALIAKFEKGQQVCLQTKFEKLGKDGKKDMLSEIQIATDFGDLKKTVENLVAAERVSFVFTKNCPLKIWTRPQGPCWRLRWTSWT